MNKLLLIAAALCALASPAFAVSTAIHVTGADASGSDPVVLGQGGEFMAIDNNGKDFNSIELFFAVPHGDAAPIITSFDFNGGAHTVAAPSLVQFFGQWTPPPKDLYTFVGCTGCNDSINAANIDLAFTSILHTAAPSSFDVYNAIIAQTFSNKDDYEDVFGTFADGTVIAPLGIETTTTCKKGVCTTSSAFFDTSWTNTGFVNAGNVINPVATVPEPSTWAMLLIGFAGLGFAGYRASRKNVALAA